MAYAFSWRGALFDLTIVGWLMWKRTRLAAYVVLVVFHAMTYLLFPEIGVFPWLMMGAALLFFPPDWPRRLMGRLQGSQPQIPCDDKLPLTLPDGKPRNWVATVAMVALAAFVAVQLLLPMRHYAYPGKVRWNDEGYLFAWRVLPSEKVGMVEYHVRDPDTGQRWRVWPEDYLTPLQTERMATQPDMILETAHIVARDFASRGYPSVMVYADAFVSMNGKPHAKLVDPDVDLAAINHSFAPKAWLVSQATSPP